MGIIPLYMRLSILLWVTAMFYACTEGEQPPIPDVISGKIERIHSFSSAFVTDRNIDIWLPEGYPGDAPYPVLYMHDGQMLYDSTKTWNKQAWEVDDVASNLIKKDIFSPFIVVGIWNGGETRHKDYFPAKPYAMLTEAQKDMVSEQLMDAGRSDSPFDPVSDEYLRFLVDELKPQIDSTYAVHKDPDHTFIAGSSMGGLISIYALCEYPEVFGGAAGISTHWPGAFFEENNPIPDAFALYLKENLPEPGSHRIYFDYGDQTLDELYPSLQQKVDSVMINRGYTEENWVTRYFPGDDHSERSWRNRLHVPLVFLFSEGETD